MQEILADFIDWPQIGQNALSIVVALVLVLPMAWDRERAQRLGLRTIPLVAVASCGFVLLGQDVAAGEPVALARFFEGLITGVGFLGGGAILKRGVNIEGTATAASIWNTAAIGAAVAVGRYEIALLLAGINFVILVALGKVGERIDGGEELDNEGETDSGAVDEGA